MRVQANLDRRGNVVRNTTAYDAKLRRKANREQRRDQSVPMLDLAALQKRAERDMKIRCTLSRDSMHADTATERVAAAQAKRKLNDTWTNRYSKNLRGFWNPKA